MTICGRLVIAVRTQQQFGRVECGGARRPGAADGRAAPGRARAFDFVESKGRRRQLAQDRSVVGLDFGGARQIAERVRVPPGRGEKTAGVNRESRRARFDLAGPDRMQDRAVDLARDGKGAAGVAMAGGPVGTALQQPLIGRRRLVDDGWQLLNSHAQKSAIDSCRGLNSKAAPAQSTAASFCPR